MRQYRIIFLLLSSLLLSSCIFLNPHRYPRPYKVRMTIIDKATLMPIIPDTAAVKYKTSIDFLNKHFTGIIVLKQTDRTTKHCVFVTELGMRMFDFEMRGDSIYPVFVFDPLNKPKLVDALARNFKSILLVEWFNNSAQIVVKSDKEALLLWQHPRHPYLFMDENKYAVEQQIFYGRKKESKTIYTNNYSNIKLKQYGLVKLYIELEKIKE